MFCITIPTIRPTEHRYILKVVLEEFLGLSFRVEESEDAREIRIQCDSDASGRSVSVAENLFCKNKQWLSPESLPKLPLETYVPPPEFGFEAGYSAPVIFGASEPLAKQNNNSITTIGFDLFGSAFFLLTRYEEIALSCRDHYGRFPAKESVLWKAGAIDRPLVDEYTEIFRRAIKLCWPETKFKERKYRVIPTHDVDVPFDFLFLPAWRAVRRSAARLILHRSISQATESWRSWRRVRAGDDLADPHYEALLRMMDLNEKAGLQGRFYFIAGHTAPEDGDYNIEHPRIRRLLRTIHARGHMIGLHPSFGSLGKPDVLNQEFTRLKTVCEEEAISQNTWSVRSHYLRWDSRHSFRDADAAGFDFDSTLAFAEVAGFRCGTCHEFSAFDVTSGTPLSLREQPLIAMECSVLQPQYQGLKFEQAAAYFSKLRTCCRAVSGQYIFLWHNSRFPTAEDWELYRQQIDNG